MDFCVIMNLGFFEICLLLDDNYINYCFEI